MKRSLIILVLILPLLSMAQFKINLGINPGVSKIYSNDSYSKNPHNIGISFKAGLETNYFFNENFGIGTGASYYYNNANWSFHGTDMGNLTSEFISLPVNLFYRFNNQKFEIVWGGSVNLRLGSNYPLHDYENGSYDDGYINLHAGFSYYLNNKTKIGFLYEAGVQPFASYKEDHSPHAHGILYFARNAYITLSYNIFDNHFKNIIQKQRDKTALDLSPFKIDLSVSTGLTKIYIKGSMGKDYWNMDSYKTGISIKEGFDISYDFKSGMGVGLGLYYSHTRSNKFINGYKNKQASSAISIPINIHYTIDLFRVGLQLGSAANFNLNKEIPDAWDTYFHANNKLYFSIHVGCFYQLSKKIKISYILEKDVQPYYTYTYMDHPSDNYYFGSMSLKLNYTLFNK